MSFAHSSRGVRTLISAALLACCFALLSASAADAHTLSVKKAQKTMRSFAKGLAQELAANGDPVTAYGAGNCKRRNAHSVACDYLIEFNDGEINCFNTGIISFRSSRSSRLKPIRFPGDPVCLDAQGNPVSKQALKAAQ